ncbi:Uncharacterised protein [Vibrio cholerae]|nr:Uncharacterised protein [Vibrio cholerae]
MNSTRFKPLWLSNTASTPNRVLMPRITRKIPEEMAAGSKWVDCVLPILMNSISSLSRPYLSMRLCAILIAFAASLILAELPSSRHLAIFLRAFCLSISKQNRFGTA